MTDYARAQVEFLKNQLRFERQRAEKEIARLNAALRRIADSPESDSILILPEGDTVWKFATEALEK